MLIVDLIDQDDFRKRLVRIGVPVPEGADPDAAARMALQQHLESPIPELQATVTDLMTHFDVMPPSIRAATEEHLLRTLR